MFSPTAFLPANRRTLTPSLTTADSFTHMSEKHLGKASMARTRGTTVNTRVSALIELRDKHSDTEQNHFTDNKNKHLSTKFPIYFA